jgi:hypothetical protein
MSKKKLSRLLVGLGMIAIILTLYFVSQVFLVQKKNEHLYHLPKDATLALRIDGASLMKNALFEILLKANDKEVITLLEQEIKKRRKSGGPSTSLGIDYLSDVLFFSAPFENKQIYGMTYKLNRPTLMSKNAPNVFGPKQVYALKGDIGVVLTYNGTESPSAKQKISMQRMADQIVSNPISTELTKHIEQKDFHQVVKLSSDESPFGEASLFTGAKAELFLQNTSILMDGELMVNKDILKDFKPPSYHLKADGFHFQTALVPKSINDTLKTFLPDFEVPLPGISSLSINYRGGEIQNTMKGLFVSPQMDLLIEFQEDFDFEQFVGQELFKKKTGMTYVNGHLKNDFISYRVDIKNSRTIYLTSHENKIVGKGWDNCYFTLSGDLTRLTEISGDRMIMTFISVMSVFSSSKALFNNIDKMDVRLMKEANTPAHLKGEIKFKEGHLPMNELLKFALANKLIKLNQ